MYGSTLMMLLSSTMAVQMILLKSSLLLQPHAATSIASPSQRIVAKETLS